MKTPAKVVILFWVVFLSWVPRAGASQKAIRVGVYQNKPKVFIDRKGRAKGFFIDILEYIAGKEDWRIEYVPGTWEQCLYRLLNRRIDLMVDVADSVARIGMFDFTHEDVFSNWATIYTPKGSAVDSVLDLKNRTIVAMRGDISYEEFRRKLKRLDIFCRYEEVDSFADVFRTLDQKKADAGIISRLFGLQYENNYRVKRTGIVCCPKNLYFAVPKHTNRFLIDALDRHLRELKQDEQSVYYTSLAKWIEGISPGRLPQWLTWALGLTAVLFLLLATGFCVLKARVNARTSDLRKTNAELEAARKRLISQMDSLKTIKTIADQLYRSLNYHTVVQQAVDAMASYSQSPLVVFFEYREGSDTFTLLASKGFEKNVLQACSRLPAGDNLTGQAIREKRVIVCNDIQNDSRIEAKVNPLLAKQGLKSILAVPLIYRDQAFGVMDLVFRQKVSPGHEQLETLLSIGKTIALALANARHMERMKREISTRKRAEEEKMQLQRQLLQAQKMEAIGTLAGGIAHDFNNILQGIYGYAQIMAFRKRKDDPDMRLLRQIEDITFKASRVVRQLLTFSREIESELKPTNLNQVIKQEIGLLEKSLSKMIRVQLELASGLWPIQADPVQLEQVLLNLCINAGHAMGESGRLTIQTQNVTLPEVQAQTMGLTSGKYVILSVADTGHGMEKGVVERIFDPFFTTKADGRGTGLGLSMVYGIVKQHHGHISCSSKPGQGTRFDVFFPAIDITIESSEVARDRQDDYRGKETILLVDDEPAVLDVGKRMLEQFGYQVMAIESPEKALDYYARFNDQIDLVILDIYMPQTSGLACLDRMRTLNARVRVLVASGNVGREVKDRALLKGAKGFIAKPYRVDDLLKTIREVLDSSPAD